MVVTVIRILHILDHYSENRNFHEDIHIVTCQGGWVSRENQLDRHAHGDQKKL